MSDWNASQYLKFEKQRTAPAIDLIKKACVVNPKKIILAAVRATALPF